MKNITLIVFIATVVCHPGRAYGDTSQTLDLPVGFSIEKLNFSVPNARQMALTPDGTLLLGTRREGSVYAVPDALTASTPQVITLFTDLNQPSGLAVNDGDLYIGAVDKVIKVADIDQHLVESPPQTLITEQLPDKTHHGWKYLKFGPDGSLYVPVGAPCNICLSDDPRFATILRMDPASGSTEIWAHGIRNTVGFDWHPADQRLWFTDNGRDMLGDDVPPDELNVISRAGEHFGYPFVHADNIRDPEFGDNAAGKGQTFTGPALQIQAHSAALGMTFYSGSQFPDAYENAAFITEHGSWNRTEKVGYQVSVVFTEDDGSLRHEPFITGWLIDEESWGRPNDVLVAPDGSLLISDDQQGIVYRVRYTGNIATR